MSRCLGDIVVPDLVSRLEDLDIAPIVPDDYGVIKALMRDKIAPGFGDAWTYLVQAVNGYSLGLNPLGLKFCTESALVPLGVFLRPFDGRLCFHIVNPLGDKRLHAIDDLCGRLRREFACPIYFKKIDDELSFAIAKHFEIDAGTFSPWHRLAPREDDTFPEVIISVEKYRQNIVEEGMKCEVVTKLRRFARKTRTKKVAWVPLEEAGTDEARKVVQQFFAFKQMQDIDISSSNDYENMLAFPGGGSELGGVTRELLFLDDLPIAFIVLERLGGSNTFGLFCNLALYQIERYVSEATVVHALEIVDRLGGSFLNLGGSESGGLDEFKRKFWPVEEHRAAWIFWE